MMWDIFIDVIPADGRDLEGMGDHFKGWIEQKINEYSQGQTEYVDIQVKRY